MRIFDNPWTFIILVVAALLLFGAPKLPGKARSLGQSMRIFKSEVKQMKDDDPRSSTPPAATRPAPDAGQQLTSPPADTAAPGHTTVAPATPQQSPE